MGGRYVRILFSEAITYCLHIGTRPVAFSKSTGLYTLKLQITERGALEVWLGDAGDIGNLRMA